MSIEKPRTLSREETDALFAPRKATVEQLSILAAKCNIETIEIAGECALVDRPEIVWQPQVNIAQSYLLLAKVIADGDCKLFYDDGAGEYFIYRWTPGPPKEGPLGHNPNMMIATFNAAMELWCSE